MTIIVTGGCGFVGTALIKALLLKQSSKIVILDMITPKPELQELAHFVWTDITDKKAVFQAFQAYEEDISCVFHVAGFGLAGTANLPAFDTQTKKVNVEGTRNVIDACIKFNVKALVFSSTVNVVFRGQEIINGTEESHLWNDNGHLDYYSQTKHLAEKLVIEANKGQNNQLKTCVLRLGGVYGPGEQTILGRSLKLMSTKLGFLSFCHRRDLKIDFLHIDNAVQGHLKAMEKLNSMNDGIGGQIFYITDGQPTNLYFFLDPLYSKIVKDKRKKCVQCPRLPHIPKNVTVGFSLIFHGLSKMFKKKYQLPFWGFTYMEAYKINVNHYFSIEKAQKILDYQPKIITDEEWKIILESLK